MLPRHHTGADRPEEFEQALPRIVSIVEEPVATSSIMPMYFVCERARQDVKVALVGQGPDELFGGYRAHLGVHYGGPGESSAGLRQVMARLSTGCRAARRKRGVYSLGVEDRLRRYQNVFSLLPGKDVDRPVPAGPAARGSGGRRRAEPVGRPAPRSRTTTNSPDSRCWSSPRRCPTNC